MEQQKSYHQTYQAPNGTVYLSREFLTEGCLFVTQDFSTVNMTTNLRFTDIQEKAKTNIKFINKKSNIIIT